MQNKKRPALSPIASALEPIPKPAFRLRARLVCALMSLALPGLPLPSQAWGPVGHKAVAILAQSRLKPETLQAIRNLAGSRIDLDWIANCADVFAHASHAACAGAITLDGDAEQSRLWHYINIPVSAQPDADSLARYCRGGTECVTAQIRRDLRILQDPSTPRRSKQAALVFLVHLVGDAHQPLHCADDMDAGGNLKSTNVILKGSKTMSLHQVWDHAVDNPGEEDDVLLFADVTAEARALADAAARDLKAVESRAPQEARSWTQAADLPAQIALESFRFAQTEIYPQYAADRGLIADPDDPRKIGKEYHDRMQPVARRRIAMAGVRLAFLLEQAFSGAEARPNALPEPSRLRQRAGDIERRLLSR